MGREPPPGTPAHGRDFGPLLEEGARPAGIAILHRVLHCCNASGNPRARPPRALVLSVFMTGPGESARAHREKPLRESDPNRFCDVSPRAITLSRSTCGIVAENGRNFTSPAGFDRIAPVLRHRRICGLRDPFSRDPKGSAFADREQEPAESTVLLHQDVGREQDT